MDPPFLPASLAHGCPVPSSRGTSAWSFFLTHQGKGLAYSSPKPQLVTQASSLLRDGFPGLPLPFCLVTMTASVTFLFLPSTGSRVEAELHGRDILLGVKLMCDIPKVKTGFLDLCEEAAVPGRNPGHVAHCRCSKKQELLFLHPLLPHLSYTTT